MRKIAEIIKAEPVNMGGLMVDQALPVKGHDQVDPFLLIHHAKMKFSAHKQMHQHGVGPHPHRGFSPVTIVLDGAVQHRDSLGNDSIVESGGVQWMHSGSGIIHSERPPKKLVDNGAAMEIIQLWVNTPKNHKFESPWYQALHKEDIPEVVSDDEKIRVQVIAGTYNGENGLAKTYSPIDLYNVFAASGGHAIFEADPSHHLIVYVASGEILINNQQRAEAKHLAIFQNESGNIEISGREDSRFILMSGKPLNEALVTYGPFVLNEASQVLESIRDYEAGNMGVLEEKFE